jgi:hypothetical protein
LIIFEIDVILGKAIKKAAIWGDRCFKHPKQGTALIVEVYGQDSGCCGRGVTRIYSCKERGVAIKVVKTAGKPNSFTAIIFFGFIP